MQRLHIIVEMPSNQAVDTEQLRVDLRVACSGSYCQPTQYTSFFSLCFRQQVLRMRLDLPGRRDLLEVRE